MVKINSSSIDSLSNGSVGSVGAPGADVRSSATGSSAKSDTVNLSSAASLLALAKSSPASRQTRIQDLSAAVKSGTYQADSTEVSHAVVESYISA